MRSKLDARMYSGYGALLGFLLTGLVLKFVLADLLDDDRQVVAFSLGGAAIGGFLGRLAFKSSFFRY